MAQMTITKSKLHNIVYETTNILNNKIYVGCHSTDNIDDGYLGSGVAITRAIRKYGKGSFSRKIIHYTESIEEMYKIEAAIVDVEFVERADTYNLKPGGYGGVIGTKHTEEMKKHLSEVKLKFYENNCHSMKGQKQTAQSCKNMSNGAKGKIISKEHRKNLSDAVSGDKNFWFGKNLDEEHREKLRKQASGRRWMKNIKLQKASQIKDINIKTYLDAGWEFGRLSKKGQINGK